MSAELSTILDFIRFGASRFGAAGLTFGHGYDNALDEATQLVLFALHLPHDLNPVYGQARLTADEKAIVLALFERRIQERRPACYLTGEAWFAQLSFKCDERALVPRSPIAELIEAGYEPWRNGRPIERVLDLCTGGGCIAIATAHFLPDAQVDAVDLSEAALSLATENAERLLVADRVRLVKSDLFNELAGEKYDLIVTNPPYVTRDEVAALPDEYRHEPESGLIAGEDGLDLALRILRDAPQYLTDDGFLICEVGESERALVGLFPQVPFIWVEFKVGQMGIFVIERDDLMTWHNEFAVIAAERGL
ncbi:MAG: 50S ribosomal protein L3 N(5)-glutamine methyltransferase [Ahniella sp.]|nr:50S ribosomal protein L3 N(5)-glutamine methyltransferase [Ahniella sp.]